MIQNGLIGAWHRIKPKVVTNPMMQTRSSPWTKNSNHS